MLLENICHSPFEKCDQMSLKKLLAKPGVHGSPLLRFRRPQFFHTFSDNIKITEIVWKTSNFVKSVKGLLCPPHLVYSFFKVIS